MDLSLPVCSEEGPSLEEWLGQGAKAAFDDICNRSPEGECEVVVNCFRIIQHSNWKIFLENQLDAVHPLDHAPLDGRCCRRDAENLFRKNWQ